MKRAVLTIVALTLALSASSQAAPNPHLEWAGKGGEFWHRVPACGDTVVGYQPLGERLIRTTIRRPDVGDSTTNGFGQHVGTVSDVSLRRSGSRTRLRVEITGDGLMCGPEPATGHGRNARFPWEVGAWRRLPRGLMRFHAWAPDTGRRLLAISERQRGSCSRSWKSPRPDAYRCITGRSVLDPCISGGPNHLLCSPTPWFRRAILVRATRFDLEGDSVRGPWAIRTGNGQRCALMSGAGAPRRRGRRLNYGCSRSGRVVPIDRGGYLWGYPKRRAGRLMIPYSRSYTDGSPWRWVRVRERWN